MATVRKLLLLMTVAVVGVLLTAGPALASHPAQYVHDSMSFNCADVLINSSNHATWYTRHICPGGDSDRYATHFGVDNQSRILYQSIATGVQYWSNCGENLPGLWGGIYFKGVPGAGGWQVFGGGAGSSIKLVKQVFYPTAPANVCDGTPDP